MRALEASANSVRIGEPGRADREPRKWASEFHRHMGVLACLVGELLASRSSSTELGLSSPRLAKARKVRDGRDPPIERHEAYHLPLTET